MMRAMYSRVKSMVKNHSTACSKVPYSASILSTLSSITACTLKLMAMIRAISNNLPDLVPTGIIGVEVAQMKRNQKLSKSCSQCAAKGHDKDAAYCKNCGAKI